MTRAASIVELLFDIMAEAAGVFTRGFLLVAGGVIALHLLHPLTA